jgi:hypothetical protein
MRCLARCWVKVDSGGILSVGLLQVLSQLTVPSHVRGFMHTGVMHHPVAMAYFYDGSDSLS